MSYIKAALEEKVCKAAYDLADIRGDFENIPAYEEILWGIWEAPTRLTDGLQEAVSNGRANDEIFDGLMSIIKEFVANAAKIVTPEKAA